VHGCRGPGPGRPPCAPSSASLRQAREASPRRREVATYHYRPWPSATWWTNELNSSNMSTGMKTENQREKVVLAARALFARYGARKTTVDEIARKAGLSKATVYNHFSGKREIVGELIDLERRQLEQAVQQAVDAAPDALGALRAFFRARLQGAQRQREFYRTADEELYPFMPEVATAVERNRRREEALLEQILLRGAAAGIIRPLPDSRLAARVLFRAVLSLTFPLFGGPVVLPGKDGVEELIDLFIFGVHFVGAAPGGRRVVGARRRATRKPSSRGRHGESPGSTAVKKGVTKA
jgi:AcrR family transcriptional regulator